VANFLVRINNLHDLLDVVRRPQLVCAADSDLVRFVQKVLRDLLHARIPCCSKEQCLSFGETLNFIHGFPNLWLEAHVKHAVGLVHHELGHIAQFCFFAFHEIVQTPGRADENMAPFRQLSTLLTFVSNSSVDTDCNDPRLSAEFVGLIFDLHGELSRRRQT